MAFNNVKNSAVVKWMCTTSGADAAEVLTVLLSISWGFNWVKESVDMSSGAMDSCELLFVGGLAGSCFFSATIRRTSNEKFIDEPEKEPVLE